MHLEPQSILATKDTVGDKLVTLASPTLVLPVLSGSAPVPDCTVSHGTWTVQSDCKTDLPSGTTSLSLDLANAVPVDNALYVTGLRDTAPVTLNLTNLTKEIITIQKNQRIA